MLSDAMKCLALSLLVCFASVIVSGQAINRDAGVQIEFPAGGELRIENQFGSVHAETWPEKYVYVTTNQAGQAKFPSVVIENRNQLFVVRVQRRLGTPTSQIDLTIKVPATARVEIVTTNGDVSLRGIPAATTIKSAGGDEEVEFVDTANADISARSTKGLIRASLPQLESDNGHVVQARLGSGKQTLRVTTETGNISLSMANVSSLHKTAPAEPDQIVPATAAGIPAPALDSQEVGEGDVIRVDSQLVTLNMSVIDRETNRGVVGLRQSDFRLLENGVEQQILQFDSSSAPFDLILLIDLSGSTHDVLKLIRAAAIRFVEAARPSDRIGVITFAGEASVVSPVTLDRNVLHQRINEMDTARGDTKLYDALDFAVSQAQPDPKTRRRTAVIVMSDGLDGSIPGVQGDGSRLGYKDLLGRVAEFDGVVYSLWLNTEYEALSPLDTQPEAFDAGYDRMKEIADTGGGVFYEVERLEDLAGAYERVVADLGTVYSLAYRPSDKVRDGKWRAIRVNVTTRPSAVARGKRGYYAN